MLALARARLAEPGFAHVAVRQADMYRLPLADRGFDIVVLQMVLHHAEDPEGAVREAVRVLAPGGRLLIIDLAEHDRSDLTGKLAHRWAGFSDAAIGRMAEAGGVKLAPVLTIPASLPIRIWQGARPVDAERTATLERAL
jgi:ArsR family transcriptional regulator